MKAIIFAAVSLSIASAALLPPQSNLLAPRQQFSFQPQQQQQVFIQPQPQQFVQARSSGAEATARVLRQESDISPDGSYVYRYETENGKY